MIGEEKALIQAPRKRERKWNQEREKGNRTDIYRLLFFQLLLYFISLYALSLFVLYFTVLMQKKQEAGRRGPPTAETKRQRKLSGHIGCYFYIFYLPLF